MVHIMRIIKSVMEIGEKKTVLTFVLLKTQLLVHKTCKICTYDFPCYIFRRWTAIISSHVFFPPQGGPPPPPPVGQGFLLVLASRSHLLDTSHSVGFLWKSDQPYAESSASQHTTLTREIYCMFLVGFEPAFPASERPQTHALDRTATGFGLSDG